MVEKIKVLIDRLKEFEKNLNESNITEFENLKEEIRLLLDDKRRIKFSQINFYSIKRSSLSNNFNNDLPF